MWPEPTHAPAKSPEVLAGKKLPWRSAAEGLPQWVILGAETGNRADKVTPRREWVDQITQFCAENEIPVFFKENLREHFNDLPASAFPWDNKAGAAEWAAHYMGRFERQV